MKDCVPQAYDGDAPVYRCQLFRVHDLDRCEVNVMIPLDPMHPRSGSNVGSELDTGVEITMHITLTSMCEDCLASIVALPIVLLPI
jgi:hypothetical protein